MSSLQCESDYKLLDDCYIIMLIIISLTGVFGCSMFCVVKAVNEDRLVLWIIFQIDSGGLVTLS